MKYLHIYYKNNNKTNEIQISILLPALFDNGSHDARVSGSTWNICALHVNKGACSLELFEYIDQIKDLFYTSYLYRDAYPIICKKEILNFSWYNEQKEKKEQNVRRQSFVFCNLFNTKINNASSKNREKKREREREREQFDLK